uniref:Pyrokinin-6 n=1 Tax=Pseudoderopeltis foveolata TaxID=303879 RepID=PPK6_PSEFO|nr:RecName: Full=Pyrokinin-6; Short=Psefo-PK-6; AltName: Full=FXPRL-amide [Pseudoderopeltis foveolata]
SDPEAPGIWFGPRL